MKEVIKVFIWVIVITGIVAVLFAQVNFNSQESNSHASSANSSTYNSSSYNSRSKESSPRDDSSTKWKEFAGTTYRASQWISNGVDAIEQNYAFSFSRSGSGKYIIYGTMPGTHVVTDQMEFNIYKVESDANCLYLYCSELSSPVKIKIKGHSLYTNDGKERFSEWD